MHLPPGNLDRRGRTAAVVCFLAIATVAMACERGTDPPADPLRGVSVRQRSPDAISDTAVEAIAHPELAFVSAMVPWNLLEPQDQAFDWTQLDADVADARERDYGIILRIMAGRLSPAWLADEGMLTLELLGTDLNAFDYCDAISIPVPWDPVLQAQYQELLGAVAAWLDEPDGADGTKGDHVYLVPISMPSILGSEMQIGFGPDVVCPEGTDGAGSNLAAINRERWTALGSVLDLRDRTEAAWQAAIDIHLETLPEEVPSVIAYGGIFGDDLAAARHLAETNVPAHPGQLWSMFTNLQPELAPDGGIAGPWAAWCPVCDEILTGALAAGGRVGLQLAATEGVDEEDEIVYAIDDAVDRYDLHFLEVNPEIAEAFGGYLLTDPDSVQDRIRAEPQGTDELAS
ncbi:MAG: beta-galactosidase [Actinomycetota bacterium]